MLLGITSLIALGTILVVAQPLTRPGYQRDPTDIVPPYGHVGVKRDWRRCGHGYDGYECWTEAKVYYEPRAHRYPIHPYGRAKIIRSSGTARNGPAAYAGQMKSILSDWIGTGWVLVPFGETNMIAPKTFSIKSGRHVRVDAVDLHCIGDRFRLEASDMDSDLVYEMLTSREKADGCHLRSADPQQAWEDGEWSQGTLKLPPGRYSIKVFVESSPYGGGTMALRARYA